MKSSRGKGRCPSLSPISLVELGRGVVSVTKGYFDNKIFKLGAIHPAGEAFRPLNPLFCNFTLIFTLHPSEEAGLVL